MKSFWEEPLLLVACLIAIASGVRPPAEQQAGAAPVDGFVARVYQGSRLSVPYRLFVPPGYSKARKYPLVLWLHGGGGGGTDNLAQISGDQVSGTRVWTTAKTQKDHPSFVVVPQVRGASWDDLVEGRNSQLLQLLDSISSEFSIDPTRIYAAGQSIGGRGVWNLIRSAPEKFAAAIILCPEQGPITPVPRVAAIPVWVFDGEKDAPWFLEMSRGFVSALRAAGGTPRLTIYPDLGMRSGRAFLRNPDSCPGYSRSVAVRTWLTCHA